jgi:hypothetical protein
MAAPLNSRAAAHLLGYGILDHGEAMFSQVCRESLNFTNVEPRWRDLWHELCSHENTLFNSAVSRPAAQTPKPNEQKYELIVQRNPFDPSDPAPALRGQLSARSSYNIF